MKIIDCFIFYNEIELLYYRLETLYNYVDYFILVESTYTFTGKEKPLHYNENKTKFNKYNDKIIHLIIDDFKYKYPDINFENKEQWHNELQQRNFIKSGLNQLKLNLEDIITITDLDEIPDLNLFNNIKNNKINIDIHKLEMDFYFYNLNSKIVSKWYHAKILSYKKFLELGLTCDEIRHYSCNVIQNGGWHLSFFGDEHFIKNKLNNFSHQEYNNNKYNDLEDIKYKITNKKDLFYPDRDIIEDIKIKDNSYLPHNYERLLTKFININ